MKLTRKEAIAKRHRRVRRKVNGTSDRPRLSVFRSHQHIYAQVIDDQQQHTLAASSTLDPTLRADLKSAATCESAAAVGRAVTQACLAKGIQKVVFDRGGNLYHGRVQALAEAAREAGLDF